MNRGRCLGVNRELTIRQGFVPWRQSWQWVDWIEYFVFRANFDRYERANNVRTRCGRLWREQHEHEQTAVAQSVHG